MSNPLFGIMKALFALLTTVYVLRMITVLVVPEPLSALVFFSTAICGVLLCLLYRSLRLIERAFSSNDLDTIAHAQQHLERYKVLNLLWGISVIINCVIEAINAFILKDYLNGVLNILVGILFVYVITKTGKGLRNYAKRLLGEKSQALRDKIVRAQEGLAGGGAIPQGA